MTYDKDKVAKLTAELIKELPGYNPLDIPDTKSGGKERFALATMFKEEGYRSYLKRATHLNISRLQDCTDEISLARQQGRIQVLKELYSLSEQMFNDALKIDKAFTE